MVQFLGPRVLIFLVFPGIWVVVFVVVATNAIMCAVIVGKRFVTGVGFFNYTNISIREA